MHQSINHHHFAGIDRGRHILVAGGDANARRLLSHQLKLHGEFSVDGVETGTAALALAKQRSYAALLAENPLPDMDGREFCRILRRGDVGLPIILLTEPGADSDAILGLDAGADDFMSKPFRIDVLLARLRAHLRRHDLSDDAITTIGPYLFQPTFRKLVDIDNGRRIYLTDKETHILKYLYRSRGRTVDHTAMLRDVWGMRPDLQTHTVRTHIWRLRRKIEPNPSENQIILSAPGGGYRLCAEWPRARSLMGDNVGQGQA